MFVSRQIENVAVTRKSRICGGGGRARRAGERMLVLAAAVAVRGDGRRYSGRNVEVLCDTRERLAQDNTEAEVQLRF